MAKQPPKKDAAHTREQNWFVYLLECAHERLYTGITCDLLRRFDQHLNGHGAIYTRFNKPVRMIAALPCENRAEASRLEYRIKRLSAHNKRLMAARWPLTQDLPCASLSECKNR